ncbi:MAG: hypothetical protein LBB86_00880 [Oscillospiraceae bacterium]|jgi:hypothetical protein|nr:hypothetical protein [Oscillospiraceae bacterium]
MSQEVIIAMAAVAAGVGLTAMLKLVTDKIGCGKAEEERAVDARITVCQQVYEKYEARLSALERKVDVYEMELQSIERYILAPASMIMHNAPLLELSE